MQILIEENGKTIGRYKSISAFAKRMELLGYSKNDIKVASDGFTEDTTYIIEVYSAGN